MPVPHLPAEIHDIISSHLAKEDLPSYRSASKYLADIGAQYLFKNLVFHASYASIRKIKHVGLNRDLKHVVQTVTWDTSLLSLDAFDFNDWKNRVRGLRRTQLMKMQQEWEAKYKDEGRVKEYMERWLWEEYERYIGLLVEEQEVQFRFLSNLEELTGLFPKLKNIIIGKKRNAHLGEEGVQDLSMELDRVLLHSPQHHASYNHSQDMFPLATVLKVAQLSTYQLETHSLNYGVFGHAVYTEHLQHLAVSQITRLHLRFSMADASSDPLDTSMSIMNCRRILQHGYLKSFLRRFTALQSLTLDFDTRSHGNGRAPATLRDIFDTAHAWPHLRTLAISHVDTSPEDLTLLLSAHAASLRNLALGDICLDPPASWAALLTNIQPELRLSTARFEFFLFDARVENFLRGRSAMLGWYCDSEACAEEGERGAVLGRKLAGFMVRGGTCPLREGGKVARVVGRLGEGVGRVEDWVEGRRVAIVS